jgi:hypothetical protein
MYGSKNRNFDSIHGGISSDDPNALEKLRAKLAKLEHSQDIMKKVNAIIKKEPTTEGRINAFLPFSNNEVSLARKLLEPDYAGRIGFDEYQRSSNSAEFAESGNGSWNWRRPRSGRTRRRSRISIPTGKTRRKA